MRKSKKTIVISKIIATVMTCSFVMTGTMGSYRTGAEVLSDDKNFVLTSKAGILSEDAVESEVTISSEDAVKIDSLHFPIIDASTGAVTFSYVYFGSYPQSEVTGEALTEEIINAEYINGTACINEEKYQCNYKEGEYHYFLYEPIRWRVIKLNDGEALLRSDLVLDCEPYGVAHKDYYKINLWMKTNIRNWLNSYNEDEKGFLHTAFTSEEIAAINAKANAKIISSMDDEYSGCVRDKVTLLSGAQLDGIAGLNKDYELKTKASDYAFAVGVSGDAVTGYASWWVKNHDALDMYGLYAGYVDENGIRYNSNNSPYCTNKERIGAVPDSENIGVCPAIVLDLNETDLWLTEEEISAGMKTERVDSYGVETGKCGENLDYVIKDDTIVISGSGIMYDYEGSNPSPFMWRENIKKVIIKEGVESVGWNAFFGLDNLTEVILPGTLKTIGTGAFYRCGLQSIIIPDGVTRIGMSAFEKCSNLEEIVIPETVTDIRGYAFYDTKWIEECQKKNPFVIVNGILLDMNACTGEAVIPETVYSIAECALYNLDSVTKIMIPSGVKHFQKYSLWQYGWKDSADKFYVEEHSVGESYMNVSYEEGYYVIKSDGSVVQAGGESEPVTEQAVLLGDTDMDGRITLSDAQKILKLALKIEAATEAGVRIADADENGKVELSDAQIILKASLKIIEWNKYISLETEKDENEDNLYHEITTEEVPNNLPSGWEPFMVYYEDKEFYMLSWNDYLNSVK